MPAIGLAMLTIVLGVMARIFLIDRRYVAVAALVLAWVSLVHDGPQALQGFPVNAKVPARARRCRSRAPHLFCQCRRVRRDEGT
jgi:hypothetical protein